MVDWAKLKAKKASVDPLFAIVFGCSGSGKSSALGTTGLSTLVLHGPTENHAATNARTRASSPDLVTGLEYTIRDEDGKINPNLTYKNLLSILRDESLAKEFGVVALDSLTELQQIIQDTHQFREFCMTDKGKINKFLEGESCVKMFNEVFAAMLVLHRKGVHILTTCAAVIKNQDETGENVEARPMLQGFSVGDGIARSFSDVLFVNLMRTDDGIKHQLLFQPTLGMVSTDANKKVSKTSFANFTPRLSYFLREDLPESSDVDLAKIIQARKDKAQ
jgi:hypothetical protein